MVKELTIKEKLINLHNLQKIDSSLSDIEILKGELPMEVKDLEDEIAGLDTRINNLTNDVDNINKEVGNHHANIAEANTLIERYTMQLDKVKNNREYDALTKEIELQKLEIQLSEKKIGETDGTIQSKKELLENAQEKKVAREKNLETKKVELEKIIEKSEKEEIKLNKKATQARKKINERLLGSYDKIRSRYRNGLAVVTVERDSCGGCFNKIPPQQIIEIGLMKTIITCEHCGRVLIDEIIDN